MANRTPKAATKRKAGSGKAERGKASAAKEETIDFEDQRAMALLDKEAAKGKGAPAKGKGKGKAKGGAKAPKEPTAQKGVPLKGHRAPKMEFADETPEPAKPGFMDRWRARREERAKEKQAEAERRAAERAAEAEREAKARAEAEERARKEAEERAAAQAEAAAAAEKERKKEERRAAAQEARRQAAEAEAAKEAAAEAKREERRLQRQAERAAIEERERQAAEQAEAEDRRRAEAKAAKAAAKEAAAAAAQEASEAEPEELEPEMEFQEGSTPVHPSRALVPAKGADKGKGKHGKGESEGPASPVDEHADKLAEELARRRSKPVVIVEDEGEAAIPRIPKPKREEPAEPLVLTEAVVDEKYQPAAPMPGPPSGLSIPEMFLLVANEGAWDERDEKAKPGQLGGALAGAIFLELLQHGRILVQRDRFTVVGEPGEDPAVEAAVAKIRSIRERKGDISSLPHMRRVAKWNRELLEPFKDRLAARGLVRHGHRMHLGLFYRSHVELLDLDAQERLQNKLRRTIAGGGTPEAASVLILGLLDACGRLETIVPDEAMDYNRKRLNGLLAGRDVMGYKVDPRLKGLQEVAIRTILQNVRLMTGGLAV